MSGADVPENALAYRIIKRGQFNIETGQALGGAYVRERKQGRLEVGLSVSILSAPPSRDQLYGLTGIPRGLIAGVDELLVGGILRYGQSICTPLSVKSTPSTKNPDHATIFGFPDPTSPNRSSAERFADSFIAALKPVGLRF